MDSWRPHDRAMVRCCWRVAFALGRRTLGWRTRVLVALFFRWRLRYGGRHSVCASRLAVQFRELSDFVSVPAERFTMRPVVWVRRAGIRWQLDLRDNLERVLYFTDTWERRTVAAVDAALAVHGVLIDVGAHVGAYSLRLADREGRRQIIAFEPASDSAAKLRIGAQSNDRVRIVRDLRYLAVELTSLLLAVTALIAAAMALIR
jgi:hypothetical protein